MRNLCNLRFHHFLWHATSFCFIKSKRSSWDFALTSLGSRGTSRDWVTWIMWSQQGDSPGTASLLSSRMSSKWRNSVIGWSSSVSLDRVSLQTFSVRTILEFSIRKTRQLIIGALTIGFAWLANPHVRFGRTWSGLWRPFKALGILRQQVPFVL